MLSTSILRRNDGKLFHVTFLSHWSDIRSDDGEMDSVKCYGPGMYVSADKGYGYLDITDKEVQQTAFRKDFGPAFDYTKCDGEYVNTVTALTFNGWRMGWITAWVISASKSLPK